MIKVNDILEATRGGLDIILYYYPQALECVNTKKAFKRREERTPSTFIKQFGNVWKITDFGDDAHAKNGIEICEEEEGRTFKEALVILGERYGVSENLSSDINKPIITQRAANVNEKDGLFVYDEKESFTQSELDVWGPNVTEEVLKSLRYVSLNSFSKTKKDEKTGRLLTTVVSSTESYPIFLRNCGDFEKIYQPNNPNKAFRFFYNGSKPKDFLNGWEELKQSFKAYNDKEEKEFYNDPDNEGKIFKPRKLKEAVICSGERDSVNCKSFGYFPLWLNSETAKFTPQMFSDVMKCVERIYNIPDIDATGVRKGVELAFKYIDIRTVFLPKWIREYKDNRGRERKDLRDFVELRSTKKDFEDLLKMARPVRFWQREKEKDNKTGKLVDHLIINSDYYMNFLSLSGFGRVVDKATKEEKLVKVENQIVKEINYKDIRAYTIGWVTNRNEDEEVINLVRNSSRTRANIMDDLPQRELTMKKCDDHSQTFFFSNSEVEVTADAIKEKRLSDSENDINETDISDIRFKRSSVSFQQSTDINGIRITPTNKNSHYFRFLINSSRIYWREELEERASANEAENERYNEENKFEICGQRLTIEEQYEQMQNLASKMFAIGYILHRYKDNHKPWGLWIMEDRITSDGTSSGGSGKSFFMRFLKCVSNILFLGGKNKRLTEDQFIFQSVKDNTDVIWVDDADKDFDFTYFYDKLTGDVTVNKKHIEAKVIPYEESPKFAFTSNFPPPNKDESTLRRLLFVIFSDYYHQQTDENGYRETRSIFDDFNLDLGGKNYTNDDWNDDVNFLIDCVQFYLQKSRQNIVVTPPMNKIKSRISIQIMGNQFKQWAEVYFSTIGGNVNTLLERQQVFYDFVNESHVKNWTTNKFTKALKEFCKECEWIEEYNPQQYINSNGNRIIRTINGKTLEMIFIQTKG